MQEYTLILEEVSLHQITRIERGAINPTIFTNPLFYFIYYVKLRNESKGTGKIIKPQHLNKIFIDCDIQ